MKGRGLCGVKEVGGCSPTSLQAMGAIRSAWDLATRDC